MNLAVLLYLFLAHFPVSTLSGRVVTGNGTPVNGVRIELNDLGGLGDLGGRDRPGKGARPLPPLATDVRGRFQAGGLLGGRYSCRLVIGTTATASFPVPVFPVVNRRDLHLPGSLLRGRVLAPDGGPAAGAAVRLTREETPGTTAAPVTNAEVTTGADGAFVFFTGVGTYALSARKPGLPPATLSGPLDIAAGSLNEVELSFGGSSVLFGHLYGLDEDEIADASVVLEKAPGESQLKAKIAEDGTYRLDGLTPGEWRVLSKSGSKREENKVVLAPGRETVLNIVFRYFPVRGRAVDAAGIPLPNRELRFQGGGEPATTQTDNDGDFFLELREDTYRVTVEGEDLTTALPLAVNGPAQLLELQFVGSP